MMRLQVLGAARQVTGSCYVVEVDGMRILVDCGLFQEREYASRNWKPFPVYPGKLDFVLLTHSHLDHAGLLPKLVREGFSGPIVTTSASRDLVEIVLLDSARIQEEDAAYKRRRHKKEGREGPYPEIPLYTVEDAEKCLPMIRSVSYKEDVTLSDNVTARFHDAGHILGAAMIELEYRRNGTTRRLIFSGDIGQWDKPLVNDPSVFRQADYIVMESTYGDRRHEDPGEIDQLLADAVNATRQAGGNLLIPSFALERTQEVLYFLNRLLRADRTTQPHVVLGVIAVQ